MSKRTGTSNRIEIQFRTFIHLSRPDSFVKLFGTCLCDGTLSVYPHRAGLKNMPGHGGIRTYDLWNTSPMLCQLSYAVRTVRVCDISELSLVPSISV